MADEFVQIEGHFPNPARAAAIARQEGFRAMQDGIGMLDREVTSRIPKRTGHAARTVHGQAYIRGNTIFAVLSIGAFYAKFLEFGTGLYGPLNRWIVPVRAKALRFPQPGNAGFTLAGRQRSGRAGAGAAWVFAKRVRGIRPRRFARDSALIVRPHVERRFHHGAERIAMRIAREA